MPSTRLQLPYLEAQQSQKHVTVNESLRRLDAIVQLAVESDAIDVEPESPEDGACYILPPGKTGDAWGAMTNLAVAYYVDGAWMQMTPREGWRAYVKDSDRTTVFDGAAWNRAALFSDIAEKLGANRTYYVNGASGNDANDGRTPGTAFATIQKAVNVVAGLMIAPFTATIDVANGTYNEDVFLPVIHGTCLIDGDTSTPSNVVVNSSSSAGFTATGLPQTWTVRGVKLTGIRGFDANGGHILFSQCEFGACTGEHIRARNIGSVQCQSSTYTVTAAGARHMTAQTQGSINVFGTTCTLSGTLNFASGFVSASTMGLVMAASATFTGGTVTGKRYDGTLNAVINTNGGGASFFPGDVAGTTATGAQYA